MTQIRSAGRNSAVITPWDPSAAFVLKSLLYPLAATASLGGALWLSHEPFQPAYFLIAVIAFVATADLLDVAPLKHERAGTVSLGNFLNIASHWFVVVGFIWALMWLSGLHDRFNPRVFMTWATITPPVLWLSQILAQQVLRSMHSQTPSRRAVIIGSNELGKALGNELLRDSSLRVDVLGYFDDLKSHAGQEGESALLGDISSLPQFILKNNVQLVYITWAMTRDAKTLELLEKLRDSTVSVYFVPDVSLANLTQARVDFVNGIPLVAVCETPFYGARGMAKRFCDILISSTAIVLLSPVLLAVAAGVRMSGAGPVIFRQKRYGLDGKEIVVYKFRSMSVVEDGTQSHQHVTRNDNRVTPFGALIRKTSLDELPQLFNVLEGSMSLVGPRPHVVAMNEKYRRLISGYMIRHKVKPGITGWAQVNGLRGGDDLESIRSRVAADLEYMRNWSLGLDIAILLRTVPLMWADRRAY